MVGRPFSTQKLKAKTFLLNQKARKQHRIVFAFIGGMVAAVPVTVAASVSFVHQPAAGTTTAPVQATQVAAAETPLGCTLPTGGQGAGGMGGGEVLGAATSLPAGGAGGGTPALSLPVGGKGGDVTTPVVQKLIGGALTASGAINGPTGPSSTNVVTSNQNETINLTNNNTVTVSNSSSANATTGSASVSGSTQGGSAQSGDASNSTATDLSISVSN